MPDRLNGPRIDERLAELGVTPKEFAGREEISDGYFRNLRNNSDLCSRHMSHRIARGLALPVTEIVLETVGDGRRGARGAKETERKEESTGPTKRQDQEKSTGPKRVAA
ncbi:hypothetical protein [Amycolatopsis rubida]|uniref:Uncharacterized protein n=1 Tax=Amycolatopsis rubida TaxID=112413 RepID=A0A1I5IKY5_9PSEU|nr:hypothetical protein [Amycolatopsis rubida]SFO60836.1 hypothetical protein SAMN05421854_102516 [Amycolatopsis rubida]